jgi:hypothetical protein
MSSKSRKLAKGNPFSLTLLAVFIAAFAVIGALLFYKSFAATTAGDINNDGTVNITDLSLLLSSYGQNTVHCTTNSTYTCDLSSPSDGVVNVFDLSILLSNYGKSVTSSCPSGQCMPIGDIQGWHQVFTDDFITNVPTGANIANGGQAGYFPQAVSAKWSAYPWPWTGTPTWANYFPERVTSIHDGQMDMWMHTETISGVAKHLITANEPKVNGESNPLYLNAGRYVMRFKTDQFSYYHASYLLWPLWDDNGTQSWPGSGEIDFPEGDYSGTVSGFMHRQDGTSGGDQDAFNTGVPIYGGWHTAVIEWKAGVSCTFILDGTTIGTTTSRVPQSPMRWVIQNGGSFSTGTAPDAANGHVFVDWVAVYTPA